LPWLRPIPMIVGQTTTRLPVDNTLSFVCQATSD
jgi:hypothetical protein